MGAAACCVCAHIMADYLCSLYPPNGGNGFALLAAPCLGDAFFLLAGFWVVPGIAELQPPGQEVEQQGGSRHTNVRTVSRYLSLARQRMVQELIQNRLHYQAEQIYGLNELIHQAMIAGQFNAAALFLHFNDAIANAGQAGIDAKKTHGTELGR